MHPERLGKDYILNLLPATLHMIYIQRCQFLSEVEIDSSEEMAGFCNISAGVPASTEPLMNRLIFFPERVR